MEYKKRGRKSKKTFLPKLPPSSEEGSADSKLKLAEPLPQEFNSKGKNFPEYESDKSAREDIEFRKKSWLWLYSIMFILPADRTYPGFVNFFSEKMALISKINTLKLEIDNMKDMQEIRALSKTNNLLRIEICKLKEYLLTNESGPVEENNYPTNSNFRDKMDRNSSNDSINIRNVIYNNCGRSYVGSLQPQEPSKISVKSNESLMGKNCNPEASKPSVKSKETFYENCPLYISTLIKYLADKQDTKAETQAIQQHIYQLLMDEHNKRLSENMTVPSAMKAVSPSCSYENPPGFSPHRSNNPPVESQMDKEQIKKPPVIPLPMNLKEEVIEETSQEDFPKIVSEGIDDLHFSYSEIKPKILEYLSDKVDKQTIVSAVRRLTKTKTKSMMRQPIEQHTKLLRVYLFQDRNILVQDVTKCVTEFARESYHSVRYYGVSLAKRTNLSSDDSTKGKPSVPRQDMVILYMVNDKIERPKFRVETIEDLMICEDFQLINQKPFIISPMTSEVVMSTHHLRMLEPYVLRALAEDQGLGIPIICISSEQYEKEASCDIPQISEVQEDYEKTLKRSASTELITEDPKIFKHETVDCSDFSIVNVEDIFRKAMQDDLMPTLVPTENPPTVIPSGNSPCGASFLESRSTPYSYVNASSVNSLPGKTAPKRVGPSTVLNTLPVKIVQRKSAAAQSRSQQQPIKSLQNAIKIRNAPMPSTVKQYQPAYCKRTSNAASGPSNHSSQPAKEGFKLDFSINIDDSDKEDDDTIVIN